MSRLWGALLTPRGGLGASIMVSDITAKGILGDERVAHIEYEEVERMIGANLHLYLVADTRGDALEIAAHRFCLEAGVFNTSDLMTWCDRKYRDWRDDRARAREAHISTPQQPHQARLF